MVLLHGNGSRGTSFNAQTALDATGFIFEDDSGEVAFLSFLQWYFVERSDQFGKLFFSLDFVEPCHAETIFRADIDAATAKDAFLPIENGKEVARRPGG